MESYDNNASSKKRECTENYQKKDDGKKYKLEKKVKENAEEVKEEIKEKKDKGKEEKKDENVNNIGNENEIKENEIRNQGESNETLNIINSINSYNSITLENNYFNRSLNVEDMKLKCSIDKSSPIKGGQDAQNNNICNSASLSLSEEGRCDKSGLAEFMDENSESN